MPKPPTAPQAKLLARLWMNEVELRSSDHYNSPTERAIIKRGWVRLSGNNGTFPSGHPFTGYKLTPEGMKAIGWHLLDAAGHKTPSR